MISPQHLRRIAFWSRDLNDEEFERSRGGIVGRTFAKGVYICHRGDRLDYWTGVESGLVKLSTVSRTSKAVTMAGLRAGAWFGEGTVLKNEPRRYDLVALRDTQLTLMNRSTFFWLFENSVAFNRFLVRQFNERLGQFIAALECDRMLDGPGRLAHHIGWLFNPVLYPGQEMHLEITQEEVGLLSGLSRQAANRYLKVLDQKNLLRVEHNGFTVLDVEQLMRYGE